MLSDEIKRLHELHQAGALTDAEFEQAKARVLSGAGVNLGKDGASGGSGTYGAHGAYGSGGTFAAGLNRLRRTRAGRMLAGVCGGLALATGVDAWVWRLLFALFTLTWGLGVVLYLLLWIFVPEE